MNAGKSIHATCVAWDGRGALIRGASGSGKSATGLMLMGLGCVLVADDRTVIARDGAQIMASCPVPIRGVIEARGIGVLRADTIATARVALVVDLDQKSGSRLPPRRTVTLLGCEIPLIGHNPGPHFASAILQFLKAGWSDA